MGNCLPCQNPSGSVTEPKKASSADAISISKFSQAHCIGKGGYGQVWKVLEKST